MATQANAIAVRGTAGQNAAGSTTLTELTPPKMRQMATLINARCWKAFA